ncbi:uncharacterized protein LOC123192677 isoform X2 [Mangifera indica]|uniref:uncharacterized protein LOC123192677 isoform X2 n=1 Tax=Mangifera indica TaxID=29780 RepID=UPI001CFB82E0|nr:uncharacterized protein LOC123192677 isoform X2 [Mangifera indica]
MGRASIPPDSDDGNAATNNTVTGLLSFHSIRDRLRFKRNPNHCQSKSQVKTAFHHYAPRNRQSNGTAAVNNRSNRKGLFSLFPFRGTYLLYFMMFLAVFGFAMASMVLQSSIASVFGSEVRRPVREAVKFGTRLRFVPRPGLHGVGLDRLRAQRRNGVRPPRIGLILGNMTKDPQSLMLITVVKNLQRLGYVFKIYAVENGTSHSMWEQIGGQISILDPEQSGHIDWSIFEGIIADSLEAKEAISSLMQEPFHSIPLIWVIQEDALANRLPVYVEKGSKHLLSDWKSTFSRASVVVFPDFSLLMLYSVLDTGNFFVINGSPVDVWAAEIYSKNHAKYQLRKENGFLQDDILVAVVGSSFFYDELSWDYAVAMHDIGPLLMKYARRNNVGGSFKFVFLCGNSTDGYNNVLQEVASRLGLLKGSMRHYGLNNDVNSVLLMADIVLYGSSQVEQGFPSLIIRAMTFGIPVIIPDFPIIKKHKHNPEDLMRAFSLFISNGRLSKFSRTVALSGRLLAKNMLASDCVTGYARLLENVLNFPSDALLPGPISQLQQASWEWNLFREEMERGIGDIPNVQQGDYSYRNSSVYVLEKEFANLVDSMNLSENENQSWAQDSLTEGDWDVLRDLENFEEYESLERQELEERIDSDIGVWDDIYRKARKSEKLKFEANERDEGELERTGQPVCIYEIYGGAGAWPFLHHGSLYRGLSLSTAARRLKSDDVDAVGRLPLLNCTYYQDILCEIGGMFSIANRVDSIHKRPWIGFQSWRAAGRKVSLSVRAEKVLEETLLETKSDVMYFWAHLDMDGGFAGSYNELTFWSLCDILNGGYCRAAFEDAFRKMYDLPSHIEALPPMPVDGGLWSALHSWVMPTPSFLEFMMFSRMFVDSLDALHTNSGEPNMCLLSSSNLEKKHCYCRVMELLVNVWAYHSGRKMVYLEPLSGSLAEQHPVNQRSRYRWGKYFNFTFLKTMDEDLAEAADDGDHPREKWLWPLTGEVHWQGIYEREREERYRLKMDKKRKTKEKLFERLRHGYRQASLGRKKSV